MADSPPLREVAGGRALLFDPLDEGAIGAAMQRLAANQVETPGALAHAGGFTWENAAKRTIEVIRSAE